MAESPHLTTGHTLGTLIKSAVVTLVEQLGTNIVLSKKPFG